MSRSACRRICDPRHASTAHPPSSHTWIPLASISARKSRTSSAAISGTGLAGSGGGAGRGRAGGTGGGFAGMLHEVDAGAIVEVQPDEERMLARKRHAFDLTSDDRLQL